MDIRGNGFINPNFVKQVENKKSYSSNNSTSATTDSSFSSVLESLKSDSEALQVSKHASVRFNSRDINLSTSQMERVQKGVNEARTKGINDSLVLVDDVALLVSVKKNTIITVMNEETSKNKVFTNIDGAVIV